MRLRSMATTNFGNLANKKLVFGEGLNVVKGPNEAGKSFSIEAITQGLYGDAASGAAQIREHCRKWGSKEAFSLELEIESKGVKYKVIRDFENKKNVLIKPDGTEVKDKESVRKMVAELVGLPSQLAFEATACIPQEEVEKIGSAVSTLREIIEGRLAGSGSDTDKIVKNINKVKESISSKSGKLGDLVTTEAEIHELEDELMTKQERLRELTKNKIELENVSQKFQGETQRLQDKDDAFKGSQEYMTAHSRFEKANKEFGLTEENLDKHKKAKEAIQVGSKELKLSQSELETLSSIIETGEDYQETQAKCKELADKATSMKTKILAINKIEMGIQEKQKEIESYKKVDHTILQNARSIPGEIRGLRSSLAEQLFGIKVELEKDVDFSIISDGKKVKGSEAEMHVEATVKFPGIASVHAKNLTGKGKPIIEEVERKEEVLKRLLKGYGVQNLEELEALHNQKEKAIAEKGNLEIKKETLLGDEDLSNLQLDLGRLEKEFKKENQIREELKSHAIAVVELERKKTNKQKLAAGIGKLRESITKNEGILEAIGNDENGLKILKMEATKELVKAEAYLEEKRIYKCTPEEFVKLKREKETLQEEVKKLNKRQIELSVKVEQETIGIEDIAALDEKLSGLRRKRERLNHKYEVLRIINDNITWARESSITQFSKGIEDQMSKILAKITNGKYKKVKLDENLGVSLYSGEKGEYINIDDKIDKLSSGTVDQVYLAARLAILGLIATEEKPPIMLDDTFVSFDDMGRKEQAFKVLESVAKDYQVLYFTCHDCPEGLKVVELT